MNSSLTQLLSSLEKASEIYQELGELAIRKRDAITGDNMDDLDKITNHEMGLVTALYKLEEIRAKIVSHLISDYGMFNVENLTDIANQLPPDERRAVLDARSKLLIGIQSVQEETKFNNKILEDRLDLIQLTINTMMEKGEVVTYSGKDKPERRNIFDAKG